jgi:palmitoyltransferase ZDHHC3/7/25
MGGRRDICGARLGTSFETRNWLALDPCGFLGISLSFSAHAFAFTGIAWHLIAGSLLATSIFLLLYTPSVILALTSLFMAWTTDPGAVPLGARPLVTVKRAASGETVRTEARRNRALRRCHKCNDNFKPNRAHHDSVTGRCIVKFDHFCPWVGNAVGAMNHKFFVLFVGYTMISCLFSLCLIGLRMWYCGFPVPYDSSGDKKYPEECTGWNESYSSLILLIISVVFLFFTACMLFENIEAIETNASKIARMKMRYERWMPENRELYLGEIVDINFFPLLRIGSDKQAQSFQELQKNLMRCLEGIPIKLHGTGSFHCQWNFHRG